MLQNVGQVLRLAALAAWSSPPARLRTSRRAASRQEYTFFMPLTLTSEQRADFARRGVSRRGFHQIAAMLAAGSAFPLFTERALAQRATDRSLAPGTVKIDDGFCFGPDVATSARATLGGMIANNSSGSHTPAYGTTADHISELEIVMADSRVATIGPGQDTLRK